MSNERQLWSTACTFSLEALIELFQRKRLIEAIFVNPASLENAIFERLGIGTMENGVSLQEPEIGSLPNKVLAMDRLVIKARVHEKVGNFCLRSCAAQLLRPVHF